MTYALPNPWLSEQPVVVQIATTNRFELDVVQFMQILLKLAAELQYEWDLIQLRKAA